MGNTMKMAGGDIDICEPFDHLVPDVLSAIRLLLVIRLLDMSDNRMPTVHQIPINSLFWCFHMEM